MLAVKVPARSGANWTWTTIAPRGGSTLVPAPAIIAKYGLPDPVGGFTSIVRWAEPPLVTVKDLFSVGCALARLISGKLSTRGPTIRILAAEAACEFAKIARIRASDPRRAANFTTCALRR